MIRPFGEAAFLVELPDSAHAQALAASLSDQPLAAVTGLVVGRASLLVEVDAPDEAIVGALEDRTRSVQAAPAHGRLRTIPVRYGEELDEVAALLDMARSDVVEQHATTELRVLFGGFAPGFAYLGDLPTSLHVGRLATPRTVTPAGSVAIAGPMSGIYPADLPGGWRVIGRTSVILFDPDRDPPAYLLPGDRVRFQPVYELPAPSAPDDW